MVCILAFQKIFCPGSEFSNPRVKLDEIYSFKKQIPRFKQFFMSFPGSDFGPIGPTFGMQAW